MQNQTIQVLLVVGNPEELNIAKQFVTKEAQKRQLKIELRTETNAESALWALNNLKFNICIIDGKLPIENRNTLQPHFAVDVLDQALLKNISTSIRVHKSNFMFRKNYFSKSVMTDEATWEAATQLAFSNHVRKTVKLIAHTIKM